MTTTRLRQPTLVLNRNRKPVNVAAVARALIRGVDSNAAKLRE
jgi:hypothetical protein